MSAFTKWAWPVAIPAAAALSMFGVVATSAVASAEPAPVEGEQAQRPDPTTIPYLGLHPHITRDGVFVRGVIEGGPADDAGIEQGDKVLSVNGVRLEERGAFREAMTGVEPGDTIEMILERDGSQFTVRVVVGSQDDRPGPEEHPWLGAHPERPDGNPDTGLVIGTVDDGSPAAAAGLQVGDEIISANGIEITSMRQAVDLMRAASPGDTLVLVVDRDGTEVTLAVILGSQAENPYREERREERQERREERREHRQDQRGGGEQGPNGGGFGA